MLVFGGVFRKRGVPRACCFFLLYGDVCALCVCLVCVATKTIDRTTLGERVFIAVVGARVDPLATDRRPPAHVATFLRVRQPSFGLKRPASVARGVTCRRQVVVGRGACGASGPCANKKEREASPLEKKLNRRRVDGAARRQLQKRGAGGNRTRRREAEPSRLVMVAGQPAYGREGGGTTDGRTGRKKTQLNLKKGKSFLSLSRPAHCWGHPRCPPQRARAIRMNAPVPLPERRTRDARRARKRRLLAKRRSDWSSLRKKKAKSCSVVFFASAW